MTKPTNFPEQKRLRRIKALGRIKSHTVGKPEKGIAAKSNAKEIAALKASIEDRTGRQTKKDRSVRGRFVRA